MVWGLTEHKDINVFGALLMLSQMLLLSVLFSHLFLEGICVRRSSRYCFSFPPPSVHFLYIYIFNCALFLQCSHVTSMQSPYVLNSNVVDYRRISHKPLSNKQRLCKNDTLTNRSSDGNLSSDAHSCIQLIVTDT